MTIQKLIILSKIIFTLTLQILNSKIFFRIFFQIIKLSHKFSINFFLKKYRTDFEVIISNKFPNKFSYYMHPFQKKILLNQFKSMENQHLSRIRKSETYYNNLKDINGLSFPQIKFTKENIFLDFPILCSSKNIKKSLFNFLLNNNIDVKNYYYKNCSEEKIYNSNFICKNAMHISDSIIMLPVRKNIDDNYQKLIIHHIKNFFSK